MTTAELLEAIRKYYSDTTRSRSATREGLEDAEDLIETLLASLGDE